MITWLRKLWRDAITDTEAQRELARTNWRDWR